MMVSVHHSNSHPNLGRLMGFFTIFQVKKVPKWVVHDVHVPVDVPVKKEVPVPVTTVKTVQVREPS